jgi:prefoldin subunit 5
MKDKKDFNTNARENTSIAFYGDVTFAEINGQFALGGNIVQTLSMPMANLNALRTSLRDFQSELDKLVIPKEDKEIIKSEIEAAIEEVDKDKPVLSKIKTLFENAIRLIGKTNTQIKTISELYGPAKRIAELIGLGASFL